MSTKNILLTGGRAPAALDLARKFKRAGHDVYVAETVRFHLCTFSNSVEKCFVVPAPSENKDAYISALIHITQANSIDLVIPTCEEVFYISQELEILRKMTDIFTDDIYKLDKLHNKFEFNKLLQNQSVSAAKSFQINSIKEYDELVNKGIISYPHVLKPVYSRFSTKTKIICRKENLNITISQKQPWVAQQYIAGKLICTYSICHQGEVLAELAYINRQSTGANGAGICIEKIVNEVLSLWIRSFVKELNYTGQIAFDIIQMNDGSLWPIECNPRATSGIHLFSSDSKIPDAFLYHTKSTTVPQKKAMLSLAMILYFFSNVKSFNKLCDWVSCLLTSKDAIFNWKDPLPFFTQIFGVINFFKISCKKKISLIEATTHDIEWNGSP